MAGLVRQTCRNWPGFDASVPLPSAACPGLGTAAALDTEASHGPDGHILLICGPTGAGKSTIGFEPHLRNLRAGLTAGYVDLDQVGFAYPAEADDPSGQRLKARNLAAIWQTYRAAGARHVVATGTVGTRQPAGATPTQYLPRPLRCADSMPGEPNSLGGSCPAAAGGSWPQPGDPLRGQPDGYLRRVADRAAGDAKNLERARFGALRIDTGGHTPIEAADLIAAAIGWPATPAGDGACSVRS